MLDTQQRAVMPTAGAVVTKATIRAADRLGISGRRLGEIIGVSEAQVSRFRAGEAKLAEKTKPFELAALLVRVFRSLDAIVGGDERSARAWMVAPNSALGARPIDRLASVQGLMDVIAYLDARRASI